MVEPFHRCGVMIESSPVLPLSSQVLSRPVAGSGLPIFGRPSCLESAGGRGHLRRRLARWDFWVLRDSDRDRPARAHGPRRGGIANRSGD
jgi:hypothetical protein